MGGSVVRKHGGYLQIGQVAERTGLTQRTIRFYEEKGLLHPAPRMEGGFRLYSEGDVERLKLVKQLKALLGFSLEEIREIVEAEEVKSHLREEYPFGDANSQREQLRRAIEVTQNQIEVVKRK